MTDVLATEYKDTHVIQYFCKLGLCSVIWSFANKIAFPHQEIGLCTSALKKEFCFLGASYWCANKRNAISCNVSVAWITICTPF